MTPLFGKVDVHEKEAFGSNRRRIKRLKHQFIQEMFYLIAINIDMRFEITLTKPLRAV